MASNNNSTIEWLLPCSYVSKCNKKEGWIYQLELNEYDQTKISLFVLKKRQKNN